MSKSGSENFLKSVFIYLMMMHPTLKAKKLNKQRYLGHQKKQTREKWRERKRGRYQKNLRDRHKRLRFYNWFLI